MTEADRAPLEREPFTPEVKLPGVKINEPTSEEGAEKLFAILCEDKVF